ncbi:hypothetical protein FGG90_10070 [Clavibacter tessellarius]|uniref:Uncharacterized protein n=1 Tax=Clavibacter tessellarius TaxID=31965 RepID=A0A225CG27_9MICO|nr:hypothetical protein [Clavibacter michiganensis]OQJ62695.1 hypothetical protein B5P24_06645 [Clavibacter michiganensis subsp. tessellarius]UKF34318.1 hypothetical protein FGG90_10070 [Clavibacter michiganensis subsp. tessellarius]
MTNAEIMELFLKTFASPDDAGLFLDFEGVDNYNWTVPRVETEDALEEVSPDLEDSQRDRLVAELNDINPAWARKSDL